MERARRGAGAPTDQKSGARAERRGAMGPHERGALGGVQGAPADQQMSGVGQWGPTSEARPAGCKGTPPINK